MGLRAENKRRKRQAIESAARALFQHGGYEGTTTRAVAEAAGVAVGTLFVYFPEKRDLLFEVMRGDIDAAVASAFARRAPDAPLLETLRAIFGAVFAVYDPHPELARVFVRETLFADETRSGELAGWTLGFVAQLSQLMVEAQQRGEVARDVPVMLAAMHCFSSYLFVLLGWLNGQLTSADRDAMLSQSLSLTLRGFATSAQGGPS
ncbi:MAG: TetR/AcrR family transcriptional regulator [Myxococcales bacterium]|nr:TetR/AcrR family transcriptional regulator [Myxococcales bacterium]